MTVALGLGSLFALWVLILTGYQNSLLALTFVLAAGAALIIGSLLLNGLRLPVLEQADRLRNVADRASRGDLSRTADEGGPIEMGRLGVAVNRLIAELREAKGDRSRLILDAALDAVVTIDQDGRIVDWNAHAELIFGWPREEALGRRISETIIPDEFRAAHDRGLRRFVDTGESALLNRRVEMSAMRRDGTVFPIEIAITPLKSGDLLHFNAFIRDITERRNAEQALRHSEERFRRLVETANVIPWEATPGADRFSYVGPQAVAMLGFSTELWQDMDFWASRLHADDLDNARQVLSTAARERVSDAFEYRIIAEDGRIVWLRDIVTFPPADRPNDAMIGFRFDITDRKRLEHQLLGAQRMEAVGRLAGGIAHDFNNLITAILGYATLATSATPADSDVAEDIAEIARAAERAAGLTQQLLAFARKQVIQPQLVDIDNLVVDLERMLKRLIGEDIELTTTPNADDTVVRVDPGQFEQVLVNLAVNARDAMPDGGTLSIETSKVELTAADSQQFAIVPGPYVRIQVSDTGAGMDAKTMARVFEPFFTTKEPGKGTGLGLATCYGIVKQASGYIWVESEEGCGTAFTIHVPTAAPVLETGEATVTSASAHADGSADETVLLVEDEPQVRSLAERALAGEGYTVLVAGDGLEAVRLSEDYEGDIDILVTDMVMPRMGGAEAASTISKQRSDIRILFISGYPDHTAEQRPGIDPGAAFMAKPFAPEQLVREVRSLSERGSRPTLS